MRRRKYLAALGSAAAGGAAMMGTGAFTSVQATRGIDVDTASDASAFLSIQRDTRGGSTTPNANEYVDITSNGTVALDFTNTQLSNTPNGQGVNRRSVTIFDDLLKIQNRGTQPVIVGHRQSFAPQKGALYHEDQNVTLAGDTPLASGTPNNRGITNLDNSSLRNLPVLSPGDTLSHVGFFVTPDATAAENFIQNGTVTFAAGDEPSDIGL